MTLTAECLHQDIRGDHCSTCGELILGQIKFILLPDGTSPQEDFVFSEARHDAYIGGRGSGKTIGSVVKGFNRSMSEPGVLGCLTAPTYPNVRDILLPAIRKMYGAGEGKVWDFKRGDMEIRFVNGSTTLLRPADSTDSMRGLTLGYFGMGEARSGRQHETFMILQGCLRQEGYKHQGWVDSTPAGRRHWLCNRWVLHQLPDGTELSHDDYKMFRAKTKDNPHNPPEFHKSLQESYGVDTKFALQELEGEFVTFEGQAFPQFDERIHVRPFPRDAKPKKSVRGLDWGAVSPTSSHVVHHMPDGRVWVTDEFYESRCNERDLVAALSDGHKVFCDPTAKDVREFLVKSGIRAKKAKSNDFKLRYRLVSARLAIGMDGLPGMYIDPSCVNFIDEVATLSFAKPKGMDMLNDKWEPGSSDHAVDDVAYALMEIDAGARGRPQPSVILTRWGHGQN